MDIIINKSLFENTIKINCKNKKCKLKNLFFCSLLEIKKNKLNNI